MTALIRHLLVVAYKLACVAIDDIDQPAHQIGPAGCLMGSQVSNISSGGNLILRSECTEVQADWNLLCKHMPNFTFCWTGSYAW